MRAFLIAGLAAAATALVSPPRRAALKAVRRAEPEAEPEAAQEAAPETKSKPSIREPRRGAAYDVSKLVGKKDEGAGFNQFDPVLTTTTFLSRRFGIAPHRVGGLAVFAVLAAVEGGEIIKTLTESAPEAGAGLEVTTASGLKYVDLLIGKGGDSPLPGAIVGLRAVVSIGDQVIYDTKDEKPIAFKYGQRPFQNVICAGVEEGIKNMKAGGKRRLIVPAALAPPGVTLPPGEALIYEIELTEVLAGYF
ncbi:hypothetical protein M885DRAFT_566393 [Pelagophyceae sp. CCMP2097]|nr:hypothetical protein M885DRAFT_566393 [Pelagophyceae sp. CCMP2097]